MTVESATLISSFAAGLATFFAPCAFPLLPGYVGYYANSVDGEVPLSGATLRGVAGGSGALLAFVAIAAVVASLGRSILPSIYRLEPLVGGALVVLGIVVLADRVPDRHVQLPARRASVGGFAVFGAGYALASTSCFAPMFFAVVLGSATLSVAGTALSVVVFGLGLALPLVLATVVAGIGLDVGTSVAPGVASRVYRLSGVVIVLAGLWQLSASLPLVL